MLALYCRFLLFETVLSQSFAYVVQVRRSTLSNTMHYKWESAYSLQMNMSLSVIALTVSAAAILVLLGAGTYSSFEPVYAQVNVMPGTDEPANTTSGGGGLGSRYSSRCWYSLQCW